MTDVWQAQIQVFALLLLWLRCCGLTTHCRNYNRNVSRAKTTMSSDPCCTAGLTYVWLSKVLFDEAGRDFQIACSGLSSKRLQPDLRLPAKPDTVRKCDQNLTNSFTLPAKLMFATQPPTMRRKAGHRDRQGQLGVSARAVTSKTLANAKRRAGDNSALVCLILGQT